MPSVPIVTPSLTGDRVELHRRAAGGADAVLDVLGQPALVEVARHRLDPGRRDADDRLGEVLVREADGLEHGPRAGAVGPSVRAAEWRLAGSEVEGVSDISDLLGRMAGDRLRPAQQRCDLYSLRVIGWPRLSHARSKPLTLAIPSAVSSRLLGLTF